MGTRLERRKNEDHVGVCVVVGGCCLGYATPEEAQNATLVTHLPGLDGALPMVSYAGFAQVDAKYDSNLFYWFFEAADKASDAATEKDIPFVIWLQGGPGGSSLFGQFVESGPYALSLDNKPTPRSITWQKWAHIAYVDNPVGTGFSYTNSPDGVCQDQDCVGRNLDSFLDAFYAAYPQYKENPLIIAGESYAGKYVYAFGAAVQSRAERGADAVNFYGIAIGDGLSDPITQIQGYADLFYNWGIVDAHERDICLDLQRQITEEIKKENWSEASNLFNLLIDGPTLQGKPDLFQVFSGSPNYFDMAISYNPVYGGDWTAYVNSTAVREVLHVGDRYFQDGSIAANGLQDDLCKSVKPLMAPLFDSVNMLVYNGQFDAIVGTPLTENMLLWFGDEWKGQKAWETSDKIIWRLQPESKIVAGYVKSYNTSTTTFSQVVVRRAGHIAPFDMPASVNAMYYNFAFGKSFA